jgi:hypothetical protein
MALPELIAIHVFAVIPLHSLTKSCKTLFGQRLVVNNNTLTLVKIWWLEHMLLALVWPFGMKCGNVLPILKIETNLLLSFKTQNDGGNNKKTKI